MFILRMGSSSLGGDVIWLGFLAGSDRVRMCLRVYNLGYVVFLCCVVYCFDGCFRFCFGVTCCFVVFDL